MRARQPLLVVFVVGLLALPAVPAAAAPEIETVASGLNAPWSLVFTSDERMIFSEKNTGIVRELVDGEQRRIHRFADVDAAGEGGLLGLAVSPSYPDGRWLYAYITTPTDNRIVRVRPGQAAQPVVTGIPDGTIHNGGRIAFGPDGMLYAGTGDADDSALAQDPGSLGGKTLRIRPDGGVPDDNPDQDSYVWTLGHRNVQGLTWDADGRMFASEFGPNQDDEINHIRPDRNYGWPQVTGRANVDGYTDPIFVRQPPEASWSGAVIPTQGRVPAWEDDLLVAALRGERLWRITLDGARVTDSASLYSGQYGRIRDVVEAPDGSVWLVTGNYGSGNDRLLRAGPATDPRIANACPEDQIDDAGFDDVDTANPHHDAIDCMVHYDVATGLSDQRYAPAKDVSRAQMASLTAHMLEVAGYDLPEPEDQGFTDVDPDNPHADAINQLVELDVLAGESDTQFSPEGDLTRAQAATVLVAAYEVMTGEALPPGGNAFSDDDGSVHAESIDAAAEAGIVTGVGGGHYRPGLPVRRDQSASLLARTLDVAVVEHDLDPQPR